jgi:hypothetical protein
MYRETSERNLSQLLAAITAYCLWLLYRGNCLRGNVLREGSLNKTERGKYSLKMEAARPSETLYLTSLRGVTTLKIWI